MANYNLTYYFILAILELVSETLSMLVSNRNDFSSKKHNMIKHTSTHGFYHVFIVCLTLFTSSTTKLHVSALGIEPEEACITKSQLSYFF